MKQNIIISGVGGQDGRYLSKFLLSKGYNVIGIVRRSSQPRDYLHSLIQEGLKVIEGDITDYSSMDKIIKEYKPHHFYHLGAQSHVGVSFQEPLHTWEATGKSTLNILEVIRNRSPETRFYNAASSEMFGSMYSRTEIIEGFYKGIKHFNGNITEMNSNHDYDYGEAFQNEETPFRPQSPYGIAKLAGYHATRLYRESYGLFTCSGILFNHESELRSLSFVTRKITNYVSRLRLWKEKVLREETGGITFDTTLTPCYISTCRLNSNKTPYGEKDSWLFGPKFEKLKLGNLDAKRDWSHSEDMIRAMYLMLCQDKPDDYVVGSGETYSVREFAEKAFAVIGEKWEDYVEVDREFIRPAEVDYLRSDPSKARNVLGWKPEISFDQLVERMVLNDIERTNIKYATYGDI